MMYIKKREDYIMSLVLKQKPTVRKINERSSGSKWQSCKLCTCLVHYFYSDLPTLFFVLFYKFDSVVRNNKVASCVFVEFIISTLIYQLHFFPSFTNTIFPFSYQIDLFVNFFKIYTEITRVEFDFIVFCFFCRSTSIQVKRLTYLNPA